MSFPYVNPSQIGAQLIRKYEQQFNFYQVKPINQIINGHYNRKTFIDLCDIRIYSQDAQFLRRVYYYRTLTGREEIDHRLKMCGQYYTNNRVMNYEYPMMVVTNTKSLFMKRDRRLRKIQAGEASSDESASQNKDQLIQPQSFYILEDIDRKSVDQDSQQECSDIEYDSQEHDVFEQDAKEQKLQIVTKNQFKNIQQEQLGHLIQDMTVKQIQQDKLQIKSSNRLNLPQYSNAQPSTDKSKSITSIEQSALKSLSLREKSNYHKYLAQPMFERILNLSSFSQQFTTPFVQNYQALKIPKKQEIEREDRRKKIRDKAQQLLKVVRSRQDIQLPLSY